MPTLIKADGAEWNLDYWPKCWFLIHDHNEKLWFLSAPMMEAKNMGLRTTSEI